MKLRAGRLRRGSKERFTSHPILKTLKLLRSAVFVSSLPPEGPAGIQARAYEHARCRLRAGDLDVDDRVLFLVCIRDF